MPGNPGILASAKDRHAERHRERFTIGYLTPRIGDNVSQVLWSGVVDAARERGVHLLCFVGNVLRDAAGLASPANLAYELANARMVDGLVSWASSLGGSLGPEGVASFHGHYQPLPIVSITLPMAGIPTVSIDSYHGLRDMMAHLIEAHGYRRLAFLRGPQGHYYAQERYRAYVDALAAHHIPFDSDLVTSPADFAPAAGAAGIRCLLDERGLRPQVDFEAVVTVSDLLALGALGELQSRGISVPEGVALAGFNDVPEGRFVTPPLTSVKLPFYEQGRRAVEMLLALLAGEPVPEQVVLPARLKIRRSCGCLLPSVVRAAVGPTAAAPAAETALPAALAARREQVLDAMIRAAETAARGLPSDWAARLLDSFVAEATGGPMVADVFLQQLDLLLRQVPLGNVPVQNWQDVLSALRRHLLSCCDRLDARTLRRAEDLWGQARVLVGEAVQRSRGHEMMQRTRQIQTLHQISQALVTAFDVAELAEVLARDLPRLEITRCYLSLYENPQRPAGGARLILAYDGGRRVGLEAAGCSFPLEQLVPIDLLDWHELDESCSLVVEPLYFRREQIGLVLFGVGPKDGTIYEVLRGQISSSLKGALLFDESRQARAAAEKADRLKTLLLTNVSHELRTPLNVIMSYTREALDSPLPGGVTLPENLRNALTHIHHSAEHQLRVINDLLDLSRAEIDELDLYLALLDPQPLLEEVFDSMASSKSRSQVTWHLRMPDRLPVIQADAVRLRQILLNLLSNAGKFVEQGTIVLGAEVTPQHLHIWVQDTGPGIPIELHEQIFEPFVTAGHANRRMEGVGLGLSITRRLVALHRGSMQVESEPGRGSTFHIYLPLPTLSDQPSVDQTPVPQESDHPVLLLISAHDSPAAEIVDCAQRQGLAIYKLQAGEDLDALMHRLHPAALAWDLANASPGDWMVVRRLKNHPRLCRAPFILYGQQAGDQAGLSVGVTDFVAKPMNGDTLMEAITGAFPRESAGPILIVDDDPQILQFYRQVISKGCPGHPIRTAADGTIALEHMTGKVPSLVVLDLMMPGMDGFDVLDWMRANDRTRQVPVLILSSRGLTLDDVKRLERHALVTLQSKGILSEAETVAALHRALFGMDALPQHTSALVKRAVAYFHQNYSRPLSRWEIAAAIDVSEDYLSRVFRQELDISPWDYLNRYRVLQGMNRLRQTNADIGTVARQIGFKDPAYFSRVFRKVTGQSPSAYRRQS